MNVTQFIAINHNQLQKVKLTRWCRLCWYSANCETNDCRVIVSIVVSHIQPFHQLDITNAFHLILQGNSLHTFATQFTGNSQTMLVNCINPFIGLNKLLSSKNTGLQSRPMELFPLLFFWGMRYPKTRD